MQAEHADDQEELQLLRNESIRTAAANTMREEAAVEMKKMRAEMEKTIAVERAATATSKVTN